VRESRLRRSVRGALSNGRPYREKLITGVKFVDGDEVAPMKSDANKNAA